MKLKILIEQLEEKFFSEKSSTTDLLYFSRHIADELNLLQNEIIWMNFELEGYEDVTKVPSYRIIGSEIKSFCPQYGYQKIDHLETAILRNPKYKTYYPNFSVTCSIAMIESAYKNNSSDNVVFEFPGSNQIIKSLKGSGRLPESIVVMIPPSAFFDIINTVRNRISKYIIQLKKYKTCDNKIDFAEIETKKDIPPITIQGDNNHISLIQNPNNSHIQSNVQELNLLVSKPQEKIEELIKYIQNFDSECLSPDQKKIQIECLRKEPKRIIPAIKNFFSNITDTKHLQKASIILDLIQKISSIVDRPSGSI